MRTVKVFLSMVMVITLMSLWGCATVTKEKAVSSYEIAGQLLLMGKNVAEPACNAGTLPEDRCIQLKKIYNDARAIYHLAGDYLILVIETDDLVKKQQLLQEHQALVMLFTGKTTELINLLAELGLIKR